MSPSGDTVLPEDSIVDLILLWLSWSHTLTASSRLFFHSWSSLKASNSCLESMTDEDLSSSTLTDWLLGNLVHKHVLLDRLKLFILASVAVTNLCRAEFLLTPHAKSSNQGRTCGHTLFLLACIHPVMSCRARWIFHPSISSGSFGSSMQAAPCIWARITHALLFYLG